MVLRHIARPLLASWFVASGVQAARKPAEHVQAARRGSGLVTTALGAEPLSEKQVTTIVRVHGVALATAGGLLAQGQDLPVLGRVVEQPRGILALELDDREAGEGPVALPHVEGPDVTPFALGPNGAIDRAVDADDLLPDRVRQADFGGSAATAVSRLLEAEQLEADRS
jgi:hypothetical protein